MKKKIRGKLSLFNLDQDEMKNVKGAVTCACGCAYRDTGGSSVAGNCSANYQQGLSSPNTTIMCVLED